MYYLVIFIYLTTSNFILAVVYIIFDFAGISRAALVCRYIAFKKHERKPPLCVNIWPVAVERKNKWFWTQNSFSIDAIRNEKLFLHASSVFYFIFQISVICLAFSKIEMIIYFICDVFVFIKSLWRIVFGLVWKYGILFIYSKL